MVITLLLLLTCNSMFLVKRRAQVDPEILKWNIRICSVNNFPTAAGLASSSSGYACLVFALAKLYQIDGDITELARLGSGSACRSIYGGWVILQNKNKIFLSTFLIC